MLPETFKALREEFAKLHKDCDDLLVLTAKEERAQKPEENESQDKRFARMDQIKMSDSNRPIATLPRWAVPKYQVEEKERKVRVYSLATSEILTLSVLNPAAACLLGWGMNTAIAWSAMTPGTDKHTLGIATAALLIFGGALQCLQWGLFISVWRESRSSDSGRSK